METGSDPDPDPACVEEAVARGSSPLRLGDFLWRPWYAKAWWIAIPIYWMPAGTSWGPSLETFYASELGVVTNIVFLPLTAGLILGLGYFRRLLAWSESSASWYDPATGIHRVPGTPPPGMDELDPRSGPQWVGNRLRNSLED